MTITNGNAKIWTAHPLDPLTPAEIRDAVQCIREYGQKHAGLFGSEGPAHFNSVTLKEPPKYSVFAWSKLSSPNLLPNPPALRRLAEVHLIDRYSRKSFQAVVELPTNLPKHATVTEPIVDTWSVMDSLLQPSLQQEELEWSEVILKRDPKIKAACDAVGVNVETIAVDGWCVGQDERFPERRLQQCFIFARNRPNDNFYAHPCDFVAVMDSHNGEVLAIDYPPSNSVDGGDHPASSATAYEQQKQSRQRFPPPAQSANYLPEEIVMDEPSFRLRETLKPLHITQPKGVSFTIEGRTVKWQNWSVHVGFSYREGLVLSQITYDDAGVTRPVFYRLSVAEMVVPYAKTIFPHHRKHAFDTGEYGVGALANSLALGCDCLGSISYMDAHMVMASGAVNTIKSAICIHEEDAGLLHKHTDFRTMVSHSARNRKLVISSICTVANYEYGFYFNFGLDGTVELEVKATGIVNSYGLAPNELRDSAHEIEVSRDVVAQHHQHLFCLRIDPMIDGPLNQVTQVDVVPDEAPVGSTENYYGNGFHTVKQTYRTAKGSVSHFDAGKSRSWVIENPNKLHPANGNFIGYKIISKDMPPLLAQEGSLVWNRAPFARANLFVTPFDPDQLYPSDVHINQHPGGQDFGLQTWVNADGDILNKDIVCWACFGVTHISRPEDWPIMPVETLRIHLKPSGFFGRNPALDVPSSADQASRLATEAKCRCT